MRPTTPARAARAAQCLHRLTTQTLRRPVIPIAQNLAQPHLSPRRQHSTNPKPPNASVDPTEVTHFNALASSWWDPHGPSRLLHLMNPLRHTFISRCRGTTSSFPQEKLRYLDIGCGGGIFAESAARLPTTKSVTAIDPTPEVLAIAKAHKRRDPRLVGNKNRLVYLNASIEDLPVPGTLGSATQSTSSEISAASEAEPYDIVCIWEVLEHVAAPGPFLEQAMQQVKPGGWLVMSTIARTWTSWLVTNVVAEDILGIVPKGTHEWGKYVNEGELRDFFAARAGWGGGAGGMKVMGVMYVPGFGWREVPGGEGWGNYFFGVRRDA